MNDPIRFFRACTTPLLCLTCGLVFAAPVEKQFSMVLSIAGDQTWKNELQWSKGNTEQRYEIDTRLRSDGLLYAENLLEPDPQKRMAIKAEYLTLRGLRALKRENGGKLPTDPKQLEDFANNAQAAVLHCQDDQDCSNVASERFAAIGALQQNSVAELDAYLKENETPVNGRYLYFFGYAGCPTTLRLQYRSHVEGAQAFDKKKEKLIPFRTDRSADMPGTAEEKAGVCKRYVATIDSRTGEVFLENAYIPTAVGTTTSTLGEITSKKQDSFPVPVQALDWTSAQLRRTKGSGSASQDFRFTRPMDGNATLLGVVDGTLKASLSWSFKDVAPSAAPAKAR